MTTAAPSSSTPPPAPSTNLLYPEPPFYMACACCRARWTELVAAHPPGWFNTPTKQRLLALGIMLPPAALQMPRLRN